MYKNLFGNIDHNNAGGEQRGERGFTVPNFFVFLGNYTPYFKDNYAKMFFVKFYIRSIILFLPYETPYCHEVGLW